ncbi:hypothetical protein BGX27_007535 [Mortierella sp. AM989]|nr:hypothetical protein BGX27_007535 [Mortierella sp. AM989]
MRNSNPQMDKPLDMYNTKFNDRNTLGDPEKHSNGIQSQERLSFTNGRKPVSNARKEAIPSPSATPLTPSLKPAIATVSCGPCKPLWQHTMTTAEQILALGLSSQEIQKQETIFELIYTESEYLDDLKSIHKIFVEELNIKMAESRRKKRFSPDKSDVKLNERLARLLSHIKDLWNGHQSLLRSLQNKQQQGKPIVVDIGSVFESFYMFSIYDSYFAQYTTTSRDFQQIANGNSELCLIIKVGEYAWICIGVTEVATLQEPDIGRNISEAYSEDLMSLTPKTDNDYSQLENALNNHQKELTKIDDRIWIEEHNEMLTDLQQRIKGLPSMVQCIGSQSASLVSFHWENTGQAASQKAMFQMDLENGEMDSGPQ